MNCEEMNRYWSHFSKGYTDKIFRELSKPQGQIWKDLIDQYRPKGGQLKVLDCGCGPGFFSILMTRAGHHVHAIDVADEMLRCTRENVARAGKMDLLTVTKMDACNPTFPDNTFDLIINRNFTWMVQDLEGTYREWLRVLKPGGRMLIFDGNWNLHEFIPEMKTQYEACLNAALEAGDFDSYDPYGDDDIPVVDLPLASVKRPEYDIRILEKLNPSRIFVDVKLPNSVHEGVYQIMYRYLSMFMICVEK